MNYYVPIGNIDQISNRSHADLQNLVGNNDHPQYAQPGVTSGQSNISYGLDASKPSTVSVGSVYSATDSKKWYYCYTANTWTEILPLYYDGTPSQGDIIIRGANGWERLAAGASGNFLQSLGSGSNLNWAAGIPNSFQPIGNYNNILQQTTTAHTNNTTSATKVSTLTANVKGFYGFSVQMKDGSGGGYVYYGLLYQNGSEIASIHANATSYTTYSFGNFYAEVNDVFDLYIYNGSVAGGIASSNSFTVYSDYGIVFTIGSNLASIAVVGAQNLGSVPTSNFTITTN